MNQPQEQIEDIRKACIAVNDDITKLQFGCHLSVKGRGDYRNTMLFIDHSVAGNLICTPCVKGAGTTTVKHENAEIIGRDIRFADVLLTLKTNFFPIGYAFLGGGKRQVELQIKSAQEYEKRTIYKLYELWNLRTDRLQDQSQDTIAFIHSLLKI